MELVSILDVLQQLFFHLKEFIQSLKETVTNPVAVISINIIIMSLL